MILKTSAYELVFYLYIPVVCFQRFDFSHDLVDCACE